MWGVYLKPFSFTRRASKHFSLRWKASSRSSCHISSFLAKLTSTISRWGVYVKDFFLSPISLFHSYTPLPQPAPASSVSLILCQYVSPFALCNSLSVSLKMFQSSHHSFQSLHVCLYVSRFLHIWCPYLLFILLCYLISCLEIKKQMEIVNYIFEPPVNSAMQSLCLIVCKKWTEEVLHLVRFLKFC